MFIRSYFPAAYFAPRYFPGAAAEAEPIFVLSRSRRYQAGSSRRAETGRSRRWVAGTSKREQ